MRRTTPHRDADVATHLASLTAADVQTRTDSGGYSRGRSYVRNGHILQPVRRDADLQALCEGSDYAPYRVTVTLARADTTGENPVSVACTCPRGGFCKHIVAMLLAWIGAPDRFEQRPPVTEQLAERSREDLVALIDRMVTRHPDLETLIDLPLPVAPGAEPGSPNVATVDEKAIRRQVRSVLVGLGEGGGSCGWGDSRDGGWSAPVELPTLVELGQSYVDAGQWANVGVVERRRPGPATRSRRGAGFPRPGRRHLPAPGGQRDRAVRRCHRPRTLLPLRV